MGRRAIGPDLVIARRLCLCMALMLALSAGGTAWAHSPGSSHLTIDVSDDTQAVVTADLALVDLAQVMPIDVNLDGNVSWGEVLQSQSGFAGYLLDRFTLTGDGQACTMTPRARDTAMIEYSGVNYVSLRFRALCAAGTSSLALDYGLFFDIDPQHHSVARIVSGGDEQLLVLAKDRPGASWTKGENVTVTGMIYEGIRHILSGYDHLLFLMMLILPAIATHNLRGSLLRIAGIVTAFTLAHSITLALAATGTLVLPAKPVEVAIALSIVFAAVVNVVRPGHHVGWHLAFTFGLLHGFGFASALAELSLASNTLLWNLLAFNLGVEMGQLLVVAAALPPLMLMALWPRYRRVLVPSLSAAGAAMGMVWTIARL